jgi:hypothetical protein
MRVAGLSLSFVWAVGWTLYGLLAGLFEFRSIAGILAHTVFPGLIFFAGVALAWRWGRIGGLVLILEGCLAYLAYPTLWTFPGILIMPIPPVLGGILVLISAWLKKPLPEKK